MPWNVRALIKTYTEHNKKHTKKSEVALIRHRIQTGSEIYPTGTQGSFGEEGGEADHSPPSSAEVKNARKYTSTLFNMSSLRVKHEVQIYLTRSRFHTLVEAFGWVSVRFVCLYCGENSLRVPTNEYSFPDAKIR